MSQEPLDSGDLDALVELVRSRGYALVVARIRDELERRRLAMEAVTEWPAFCGLRGQVAALRTVLDIPQILKEEIVAQLGDRESDSGATDDGRT